jgi:hypothetical protein
MVHKPVFWEKMTPLYRSNFYLPFCVYCILLRTDFMLSADDYVELRGRQQHICEPWNFNIV